jgi:hypothetical protein
MVIWLHHPSIHLIIIIIIIIIKAIEPLMPGLPWKPSGTNKGYGAPVCLKGERVGPASFKRRRVQYHHVLVCLHCLHHMSLHEDPVTPLSRGLAVLELCTGRNKRAVQPARCGCGSWRKARTRLSPFHLLTTLFGNKGMPCQRCQSGYLHTRGRF